MHFPCREYGLQWTVYSRGSSEIRWDNRTKHRADNVRVMPHMFMSSTRRMTAATVFMTFTTAVGFSPTLHDVSLRCTYGVVILSIDRDPFMDGPHPETYSKPGVIGPEEGPRCYWQGHRCKDNGIDEDSTKL